jgi:RNA polymerase primary sigma factor
MGLSQIQSDVSLDSTRAYLNEIGRHPLLNKEQEFELSTTFHEGERVTQVLQYLSEQSDRENSLEEYIEQTLVATLGQIAVNNGVVERGEAAKEKMILSNLRLSVSIAKRYQNNGLPLLDLVQEGNIGLNRAVEKFDPNKGFKFSTYATWWITQAVTRSILDKGATIRVPVHMSESINKLRKVEAMSMGELGVIDDSYICEKLGINFDKLSAWRTVERQSNVFSLNEPDNEEGSSEFGDHIADKESSKAYDQSDSQIVFEEFWKMAEDILDERELEIIRLRFGINCAESHSLEQVGKIFNLTRERIRQIQDKAIKKIRNDYAVKTFKEYLH